MTVVAVAIGVAAVRHAAAAIVTVSGPPAATVAATARSVAIVRAAAVHEASASDAFLSAAVGEFAMLWSVRISMMLLAIAFWRLWFVDRATIGDADEESKRSGVAVGVATSDNPSATKRRTGVLLATAWLLSVIHVWLAFQVRHGWSLSAAELHTAQVTARVLGMGWGGGLYVNFAFLAWWGVVAVAAVWRHRFPSRLFWVAAAFMVFNATAVFGPRWWALVVSLFLLAAAYQRFCQSSSGVRSG